MTEELTTLAGKGEAAQKRRLEAFITRDYKVNEDDRTEWTRVGVAFEHASGRGFTLNITPGLSVSGQLVLLESREKEANGKNNIPA